MLRLRSMKRVMVSALVRCLNGYRSGFEDFVYRSIDQVSTLFFSYHRSRYLVICAGSFLEEVECGWQKRFCYRKDDFCLFSLDRDSWRQRARGNKYT